MKLRPQAAHPTIIRLFRVTIESSHVFSASNNWVRSHRTAARLIALCNSRALPAAREKQGSARRVVVCRSVARTHAMPCRPVPTRPDLHNRRVEVRSGNWGTPFGPMRPLKAPKRLLREREFSSFAFSLVLCGRLASGHLTRRVPIRSGAMNHRSPKYPGG